MKKLTLFTITVVIGIAFIINPALAATNFSLSLPVGTEYEVGDTFKVNITISPSEKIYTVKAQINYPAELLKVESFDFASGWMPLSQAGYDSIDNINGSLIKTGGFPGGFNSQKTLGTVTFSVINKGQASIGFTTESLALNADNTDNSGSLASVNLNLNPIPVVTEPAEEPSEEFGEKVTEELKKEEVIEAEKTEEGVIPSSIKETKLPSRISAGFLTAATILTLGTGNNIVTILVLFAIFIAFAFLYDKRIRKSRKPKVKKKK